MTLSTYVYVKEPVDRRELFTECNRIIGSHEGVQFTADEDGIANRPDQGLNAWLLIRAHEDGVTYANDPAAEHGRFCDGPDDDCYHGEEDEGDCRDEPAFAEVNFDTAYSHRDEYGGCGELHARYIVMLGRWLEAKGLTWTWRNEFTGEINAGYDGLAGLSWSGQKAADWFASSVVPALRAQYGEDIQFSG